MGKKRDLVKSGTEVKLHAIARLQLLDWPLEKIAEHMGLSHDSIAAYVRLPAYLKIRDSLLKETYSTVDNAIQQRKANVMLEEASPDAAQALQDLLAVSRPKRDEDGNLIPDGCDAETARLTSIAILDRAGYGVIQRKMERRRLEMDPILAALMAEALKESQSSTKKRPKVIEVTPEKA